MFNPEQCKDRKKEGGTEGRRKRQDRDRKENTIGAVGDLDKWQNTDLIIFEALGFVQH